MAQSKEKILFIITKATWGGAQHYVHDLATHVPKEKFQVTVAYGEDGKLSRKLAAAGISTWALPSLARDIAVWSDAKSFFEIRNCILSEKPDVVHLNSSKAAALGALAARLAGVKKIIFTVHGWPFKERRNFLWRTFVYLMSLTTAALSHVVICVSEDDLRRGRRMLFVGYKAVLIHSGIDLHMSFGTGEGIRRAFPAGARITGTIGELTKNKNQIAFIEKARATPDMYVAIIGEGEDREMLERKIKEYGLQQRIKLFGFVPASEALKGFDVFALPSLKEGLPYVLLEAKLAGLPIEANRVGGVGEILDSDINKFSLTQMVEKTVALY